MCNLCVIYVVIYVKNCIDSADGNVKSMQWKCQIYAMDLPISCSGMYCVETIDSIYSRIIQPIRHNLAILFDTLSGPRPGALWLFRLFACAREPLDLQSTCPL